MNLLYMCCLKSASVLSSTSLSSTCATLRFLCAGAAAAAVDVAADDDAALPLAATICQKQRGKCKQ
jgi:hypothetical protein